MESRYREEEAANFIKKYSHLPKELALRVYTSHLIGSDANLVLHGGGNTSVKVLTKNILGEEMDVIHVKGSGWDLATIEPAGLPGLDLSYLRKFRSIETLSDEEMINQLRTNLLDSSSPDPSVETFLHAFLPHTFVDHTHAESILVLTNREDGDDLVREALGPKVAILPYIMAGFSLSKAVIDLYEKDPDVEAIVLSYHGVFTFAEDAKTSYERMIDYVDRAEKFIENKIGGRALTHRRTQAPADKTKALARLNPILRGALAHADAGGRLRRFILEVRDDADLVEASLSEEAEKIASTGVLTPDHLIRTKNFPVFISRLPEENEGLREVVLNEVETYKQNYDAYFDSNVRSKGLSLKKIDPYPRVFLVAGVGLVAAGFTRRDAMIAADIAQNSVVSKLGAIALGEYRSLPETHLFDMEYWVLQQKKLNESSAPPLAGQVAIVTGGGGAMGYGISDRLLAAGAVVVLTDINPERLEKVRSKLAATYGEGQVESVIMDVTDLKSVMEGFDEVCRRLGGIDIVVPNAGSAHVAEIEQETFETFKKVVDVNFTGTFNVIKAAAGVFRRQGTGGNIVLSSSKTVFDPGAAFGAYSSSKAAAHQLAKVASIELAGLSVRVNSINADGVFGSEDVPSGLWEEVGPERMKSRGLSPDELKSYYRNRNLLKAEILAEHVGNGVVFFATEQTPTTGASLPVDGGIPGAFPR